MPESFRSSTVRSDWGRFDKQADRILSVRRHIPVFGDWGDCLEKSRSMRDSAVLRPISPLLRCCRGKSRPEESEPLRLTAPSPRFPTDRRPGAIRPGRWLSCRAGRPSRRLRPRWRPAMRRRSRRCGAGRRRRVLPDDGLPLLALARARAPSPAG